MAWMAVGLCRGAAAGVLKAMKHHYTQAREGGVALPGALQGGKCAVLAAAGTTRCQHDCYALLVSLYGVPLRPSGVASAAARFLVCRIAEC